MEKDNDYSNNSHLLCKYKLLSIRTIPTMNFW
jgi:hypothetical protein